MLKKKYLSLHEKIYWLVLVLTLFGLLMSFSTTYTYFFTSSNVSPYRDLLKQTIFALSGFVAISVICRLPVKFWKSIALPFYVVSCGLLVLVLVPPFYSTRILNESGEVARRWLNLGFFSFQPSELVKFAIILMLSAWMSKLKGRMNFNEFMKSLIFVIIPVFLIIVEPNFSTAIIVLLLGVATMMVGATPLKYFFLTAVPITGIGFLVLTRSERLMNRIFSFQNVFQDPSNSGYQVLQSFIAIARGSWFGKGFMRSSQKFYSLPEAQTDFVYSIICEEFGLLVGIFVLFLYFLLFFWAIQVALKLKEGFSSLLASMIGFHIFLQAMMHIAVTIGFLPPTGIPLPFVSIGGTALVVYLAEAGVLIRLAKKAETIA